MSGGIQSLSPPGVGSRLPIPNLLGKNVLGEGKALSWLNLRFDVRAYVERNYSRVVFRALAVQ